MNGPDKLERYIIPDRKCLPGINALAYSAHYKKKD